MIWNAETGVKGTTLSKFTIWLTKLLLTFTFHHFQKLPDQSPGHIKDIIDQNGVDPGHSCYDP